MGVDLEVDRDLAWGAAHVTTTSTLDGIDIAICWQGLAAAGTGSGKALDMTRGPFGPPSKSRKERSLIQQF